MIKPDMSTFSFGIGLLVGLLAALFFWVVWQCAKDSQDLFPELPRPQVEHLPDPNEAEPETDLGYEESPCGGKMDAARKSAAKLKEATP